MFSFFFLFSFILLNKILLLIFLNSRMVLSYSFMVCVYENLPMRG